MPKSAKIIPTIDVPAFVATVKKQFRTIKPVWKQPYETAVSVAKRMGLTIQINGKPGAYWAKNAQRVFDDVDNFDYDLRIKLTKGKEVASVNLEWANSRVVKEF